MATWNGVSKGVWRIIAIGAAALVFAIGGSFVKGFNDEQKVHCSRLANHENRLATIEANYQHIAKALDRIEKKLERRN